MANSEHYNSMKSGSNPTQFQVAGVEVSEELARAIAERKAADSARAGGNANGTHNEQIDDEKIRELTAKYSGKVGQQKGGDAEGGYKQYGDGKGGKGQEPGGSLASKAGQAKDKAGERVEDGFYRGAEKGRRQQTEDVGTGKGTRTDKFKDTFRSPHEYRGDDEEEGKEGKPLHKRPLLITTVVLGIAAVVGVLLTGSRHGKRHVGGNTSSPR